MKTRILSLLLASAMLLSLAACGGKPENGSSNPGSSSDNSSASSQPDGSSPDASAPDGSVSTPEDGASSSQPDSSADASQPDVTPTLTMNKVDVTLKKAGSTFQLRCSVEPDIFDGIATFTSNKPEIASVDENGTVTAVAPGTATITVKYDSIEASCIVRCKWDDASSDSSSSSGSSSASKVDLQSFYDAAVEKYEFSAMMEADTDTLANFYAGLSDLTLSQQVVYLCLMSPSPVGDFALVQVSDAKDVETVKAIFQARIDYMVGDGNGPGGAWYPGPTEMWENESRIVSNGNYVMLVVHEKCDDIVKEFNALF